MNDTRTKLEVAEDAAEAHKWKRVYITVLIYTAFLILGLWGFSQIYT
jgi:hypothetical protein